MGLDLTRRALLAAVAAQNWPQFRGPLASDDLSEQQWKLLCLDRGTGKIRWDRTAYRGTPREKRHIKSTYASSTPVTAGGRIYLAGEDGDIFSVRAGRRFELLGSKPMGEPLMATPAVSGELFQVRGQHHLWALGRAAGGT